MWAFVLVDALSTSTAVGQPRTGVVRLNDGGYVGGKIKTVDGEDGLAGGALAVTTPCFVEPLFVGMPQVRSVRYADEDAVGGDAASGGGERFEVRQRGGGRWVSPTIRWDGSAVVAGLGVGPISGGSGAEVDDREIRLDAGSVATVRRVANVDGSSGRTLVPGERSAWTLRRNGRRRTLPGESLSEIELDQTHDVAVAGVAGGGGRRWTVRLGVDDDTDVRVMFGREVPALREGERFRGNNDSMKYRRDDLEVWGKLNDRSVEVTRVDGTWVAVIRSAEGRKLRIVDGLQMDDELAFHVDVDPDGESIVLRDMREHAVATFEWQPPPATSDRGPVVVRRNDGFFGRLGGLIRGAVTSAEPPAGHVAIVHLGDRTVVREVATGEIPESGDGAEKTDVAEGDWQNWSSPELVGPPRPGGPVEPPGRMVAEVSPRSGGGSVVGIVEHWDEDRVVVWTAENDDWRRREVENWSAVEVKRGRPAGEVAASEDGGAEIVVRGPGGQRLRLADLVADRGGYRGRMSGSDQTFRLPAGWAGSWFRNERAVAPEGDGGVAWGWLSSASGGEGAVRLPGRLAIDGDGTVRFAPGVDGGESEALALANDFRGRWSGSGEASDADGTTVKSKRRTGKVRGRQGRRGSAKATRETERYRLGGGVVGLRTGETIEADVRGIDGESAEVVRSGAEGPVRVPIDRLSHVVLGGGSLTLDAERLRRLRMVPRAMRDRMPTHALVSRAGDVVRGWLLSADAKTVRMKVRTEVMEVPRGLVSAVVWLSPPEGDGGVEDDGGVAESGVRFLMPAGDGALAVEPVAIEGDRLRGRHPVLGESDWKLGPGTRFAIAPAGSDWREVATRRTPAGGSGASGSSLAGGWELSVAPEPIEPGGVAPAVASPWVGRPAPEVTLPRLGGGRWEASSARGKVLVMDFWAGWCGPCLRAMPVVEGVLDEFSPADVALIAVNQQESEDDAAAALKRIGVAVDVAMDVDGVAAQRYRIDAIPQTFVIDRGGVVRAVFVGVGEDLDETLRTAIRDALNR